MHNTPKLDFNDILICPEAQTGISSRDSIDIFYPNSGLPLMTAPMDTVISSGNEHAFGTNGITTCLPRGEKTSFNGIESYSLSGILDKHHSKGLDKHRRYLIDTANGHISSLEEATRLIKDTYGDDVWLMVGNIANPKTYSILSNAGADAIRVGIGNGAGCLTTQQTGVGYPMASLINECRAESLLLEKPAKIVADGGMKEYSDIIKALALGADYVMLGSIFNKALESSSTCMYESHFAGNPTGLKELTNIEALEKFNEGYLIFKNFRGMSTKEVQKKWGSKSTKTSEGISEVRQVEYTLSGWTENFKHYLKSAMSYTNSKSLEEFIGECNIVKISDNSQLRFKK